MKKVVIFVILFILIIPICSAKEIGIKELFQVGNKVETPSAETGGTTTYFYAGSKLIASKNGNIKYHYQDRMGSDTDSKSLPFGQEIYSDERFSFTGKELDASDLHYFGARYYDSNLGKFTSVDPIPSEPPYAYVSNNPMNYVDPSGKLPRGGLEERAWRSGVDSPSVPSPSSPYSSLDQIVNLDVSGGIDYWGESRYHDTDWGLIDLGHMGVASPDTILARFERAYQEGRESGEMGSFEVYMGQIDKTEGMLLQMDIYLDPSLADGPELTEDQINAKAFGIFVRLSEEFESYQSKGKNFFKLTSYSEEDLRSNYLGWFVTTHSELGASKGERINRVMYAMGAKPIYLSTKWNERFFAISKYFPLRKSMPGNGDLPNWVIENVPTPDDSQWDFGNVRGR